LSFLGKDILVYISFKTTQAENFLV